MTAVEERLPEFGGACSRHNFQSTTEYAEVELCLSAVTNTSTMKAATEDTPVYKSPCVIFIFPSKPNDAGYQCSLYGNGTTPSTPFQ